MNWRLLAVPALLLAGLTGCRSPHANRPQADPDADSQARADPADDDWPWAYLDDCDGSGTFID